MKYNPMEGRCCFVDGPVAVYVHEAPALDILEAYARLARMVAIAAEQLNPGAGECTPKAETDQYLPASCWSEKLGEIRKSEQLSPSKEQAGKS